MVEQNNRGPDAGPQEPNHVGDRRPAPRVYGGVEVYDPFDIWAERGGPRVYFARIGPPRFMAPES